MKAIKTGELSGPALDWAVARCEGGWVLGPESFTPHHHLGRMNFSTDWAQGGPIIEQEGIGLLYDAGSACRKPSWFATTDDQCTIESYEGEHFDPAFLVAESAGTRGPTPLIAAMRCYVTSKLGETVEVPEELL